MNHLAKNPLDAAVARIHARVETGTVLGRQAMLDEIMGLTGTYHGELRGAKGQHEREYKVEFSQLPALIKHLDAFEAYLRTLTEVKWERDAPNVVTTVGANALLDAGLAGSSYTAATYMGLIGAVSYSGVPVIGDTMASHSTWTEAGGTNAPTYTGPRKTVSWSAAASKSKSPSSAPVFAITGSGTAKGVFLVYGSGAVATLDSTAGVLYSAGLFTGGDQVVAATNTLTVTYAATA
jgi:hypothetical protein